MGKATVAGVCREYLEKAGCEVEVATLHAQCILAGLNVVEAQVLANLRVAVSQGKLSKGSNSKSFATLNLKAPSIKLAVVEQPVKPAKKEKFKAVTAENTLQTIEALLGPPISKPSDRSADYFLLEGTETGSAIIEAAAQRLGTRKLSWFIQVIGGSTHVCILEK